MQLVWDIEKYVRIHVQTFKELFDADLSDVEVKGHREHVKECIRDHGVNPTTILVDECEKNFISKFLEEGRGILFTTGRRPRTIYVVTTLDNQLKYGNDQGELEVASVHDLTHVFFRELTKKYAQRYEVHIHGDVIGTEEWVENVLVPELKKVAKRDTQIDIYY